MYSQHMIHKNISLVKEMEIKTECDVQEFKHCFHIYKSLTGKIKLK
jgi:hypothetical protein